MVELTEQVIEAYCTNRLSAEEVEEFEVQLRTNEDLQKEVRMMLLTLGSLKEITVNELKTRLETADKEPKVVKMEASRTWLRWAAAILIIAVSGYFIFLQFSKPDPINIYLTYMEPYPNVIDPGTRDVGTQSLEALQLYDQGNYLAAMDSFDQYLHLNPDDIEMSFYFGISALLTENFELAEETLLTVANSGSRLSNQATWYLSLTLIRIEKLEFAKENLQKLIDADNSYSKRAKEIMRKL